MGPRVVSGVTPLRTGGQRVAQEPSDARGRVEAAETELGMELSARLQPFQGRCDQAVAEGDADGLCGGKDGRWERICVLPGGRGTSMEEPHWGGISEGWPIAWVGSASDDW